MPALVCEIDGTVPGLSSCAATADYVELTTGLSRRMHKRTCVVVGAGRAVERVGEIDRTLREAQHVGRRRSLAAVRRKRTGFTQRA
ncbi:MULTISPECIES: hypothetical protein [unclassified Mycolicibacterium]|uniref:hypothetical protein n=1 Tax=unclassified Mycolicibacterium TaxID=2636767 RepID=UPI0035CB28ED